MALRTWSLVSSTLLRACSNIFLEKSASEAAAWRASSARAACSRAQEALRYWPYSASDTVLLHASTLLKSVATLPASTHMQRTSLYCLKPIKKPLEVVQRHTHSGTTCFHRRQQSRLVRLVLRICSAGQCTTCTTA